MSPRKLSKGAQEDIVQQLEVGMETLEEEEFNELFEQLDDHHKMKVRDSMREFADDAIGTSHWDSDA